MIRLQKWIAMHGIASRREADRWITEGRLAVNGSTAQPGQKVDPDSDVVSLDKKQIAQPVAPKLYWLLNKPVRTLCSRKADSQDMACIYQLRSLSQLKFPLQSIGRLDFMSEGLLLLTNDGALAHKITHPKFGLAKSYSVWIDRKLTAEEENRLRHGLPLEDGTASCTIQYNGFQPRLRRFQYKVTVTEGRNRLIRRMFEALDCQVKKLLRTKVGPIALPHGMPVGDARALTSEEIKSLKRCVPDEG